MSLKHLVGVCCVASAIVAPGAALAANFQWTVAGRQIDVTSNTSIIGGAAVRLEERDDDLIGKAHLDPNVCGRTNGVLHYQGCQGLFRTQTFPAERVTNAPGFASLNFDQGNLNYDRYDVTQGLVRIGQDLNLTYGDYGFFVKGFFFHDFINNDFEELRPNLITPENADRVGFVSTPGTELVRTPSVPIIGPAPVPATVLGVRNDSRPCPADRNPGIPGVTPCGIVYGPGERTLTPRTDDETLHEIGQAFHLLDLNFYGAFDAPYINRKVQFKIGKQAINWGESTVQFFDSLNVVNPPSLNNLFRLGGNGLDDFFLPINAVSLTTELFPSSILSVHYQLEWKPLVAPAPGGYYSVANIGTSNAGYKVLTNSFGSGADNPEFVPGLLDNPLSGITDTTLGIERLPDREPGSDGQYGIDLKYYNENLNDGTELGFYMMNYHARMPILSVISADLSCAKSGLVPVTDGATLAAACPDLPIFHAATSPNDPEGVTDSTVAFDTLKVLLDYPKNIKMYGLSFNTTVGGSGGISLQGEVAYRPNDPLQVAIVDLAFAGYGPTLTNCHIAPGCLGSNTGVGTMPDGSVGTYGSSNYVVDANGTPGAYPDNFDAIVGHIPGSGRSFPSFIIPFRGGTVGLNPPNSYIQGWENFETYSFNLGATYVEGNTNFTPKLIRADQLIWLFEVGARWVPHIPDLDVLQLETPGIQYHASAGADGSGGDRSRQACSTNEACSFGPDGLRFNPHQQDLSLYGTELSYGYSIVQLIRYESIYPGISLGIQNILKHDLEGHSPGLASNFIEDRILLDSGFELRYKSNWSFNVGYQWFTGGGVANVLKDRDNARAFVKYSF